MGGAKNPKLKERGGQQERGRAPGHMDNIFLCVGQMKNSVVVCIKRTSRGDGGTEAETFLAFGRAMEAAYLSFCNI